MKDYASESQRKAYNKGVIARINGHSENDNPHKHRAMEYYEPTLYGCWLAGYNEKGSLAEKTKQKTEIIGE